jgi:hypothetical protein
MRRQIFVQCNTPMSRDSAVGIATGYWLGSRGIGVPFPAGARDFSLPYSIHTGSGAQSTSSPMGTGGSLPRGKAVEA